MNTMELMSPWREKRDVVRGSPGDQLTPTGLTGHGAKRPPCLGRGRRHTTRGVSPRPAARGRRRGRGGGGGVGVGVCVCVCVSG